MSYDYIFSRELNIDGIWDINNPSRVDGDGNQILLSKEIESALPGKYFTTDCAMSSAGVNFEQELTLEELGTLTMVVNNHKNNL